ncbi:MAG: PH domain-containing protein [Candidatus Komeilibacteria bacterium]|nr:PH domain-containing protein [Candidatus Komeilibacteria bacterium]
MSNYRNTCLLITNHRVIILEQTHWWHQTVQPISYQQIHDVTYSREGAAENIFNFGNLHLRIMTGNIIIKDIRQPKVWQETIINLKNFYTTTPMEQWDKGMLLDAVKKIQDKLGGEVLQRLLK